jgi:hypothetical protein
VTVITAPGRLRQEDCKFKAILGSIVRPCLKKEGVKIVDMRPLPLERPKRLTLGWSLRTWSLGVFSALTNW